MKKWTAVLLVIGLGVGCELRPPVQPSATPGASSEGAKAVATVATPDASLDYIQGGEGVFSLSGLKGRVVLLDVAAPWSAGSRALIPEFNRLHEEQQSAGLSVIGLLVDAKTQEGMTPEFLEMGARYPLVAASRSGLSRVTSVRSVPARLLFDRKGQLRKQYPGDVNADALRADIDELLKEGATPAS